MIPGGVRFEDHPIQSVVVLSQFLRVVSAVHRSGLGTNELSYYPPIGALLEEVGKRLEPRVKCVMNLRNAGAGLPDGGLYSGARTGGVGNEPAIPDRAAIEVKAPEDDLEQPAIADQILRYAERYGLVLATNLREWRLVRIVNGTLAVEDRFVVAESADDFWRLGAAPANLTDDSNSAFEDFLIRSLLRGAPLREANDVALLMASYAREARSRLGSNNPAALRTLKGALEGSLGIRFQRGDGDAFFRSTLIQTLFYGIFSAWVLWSRDPERRAADQFNWHDTPWRLQVPMVRSLFEQIAQPGLLNPLRMTSLLDAVAAALNRIDRQTFFAAFDTGNVVQHFYEPFLRSFDPKLRKRMGVWFTPPEIVDFMVRRVEHVLRTHMDTAGLSDPRVFILDPCVGTGSFLMSVLRHIYATLGAGPAAALALKEVAQTRVFGFELLPAPYIVAHLQIGMLLQTLGAPLEANDQHEERAQVYLTNSLTGWREQDLGEQPLPFPAFEEERDHANEVKRDAPIWVIIGNPPYDGFSGVSPQEEAGLIDPYKEHLRRDFNITKHKLDDPYVRFFRIAENKIAGNAPFRGIVCYVSNYSFVSHKSAVLLRRSLLSNFDRLWLENLHGNRAISEYGPDGRTSETIFALEGFSPGIKQGVVTSLWLKTTPNQDVDAVVRYRDDFNASRASERRAQMLEALGSPDFEEQYTTVIPTRPRYFALKPATTLAQYAEWPSVEQLAASPSSLGLNENRRGALISDNRDSLEERMEAYFGDATNAEITALGGRGIVTNAARFDARRVRANLREEEAFDAGRIRRFLFRPMDVRWAYHTGGKLWNEGRSEFFSSAPEGTVFVIYRRNGVDENDGPSLLLARTIGDQHALHKDAYFYSF